MSCLLSKKMLLRVVVLFCFLTFSSCSCSGTSRAASLKAKDAEMVMLLKAKSSPIAFIAWRKDTHR